jgi:outer membrane protein TolC
VKTESEFLKQNNKLLQIIEIKKQELGYIQKGYEEELKPDLQVFAELGISSKEEFMPKSFLMDNPTTTVGATILIPLGNSRPINQISAAKLKVKKLEREETEIIQDFETQINNLIEQLKVIPSVFDLNRELLDASRKRTIEEKILYDRGLGDISSLLQSRDNEVQFELQYLLHSMEIHTLLLELDFLQGRLLKEETWEK